MGVSHTRLLGIGWLGLSPKMAEKDENIMFEIKKTECGR